MSGRAMRPGLGVSAGRDGPGGLCSGGSNSGGAPGNEPAQLWPRLGKQVYALALLLVSCQDKHLSAAQHHQCSSAYWAGYLVAALVA
jgi:hypothetical protein